MTPKIPCRHCGELKPRSEVTTRFQALGKQGWRIRFKACHACKLKMKNKKKEKVLTI